MLHFRSVYCCFAVVVLVAVAWLLLLPKPNPYSQKETSKHRYGTRNLEIRWIHNSVNTQKNKSNNKNDAQNEKNSSKRFPRLAGFFIGCAFFHLVERWECNQLALTFGTYFLILACA